MNNKWLENVGQQLACPKVVHARKAKATYMLPMGYVDWIGKYMNMKGRTKTVFLPIFFVLATKTMYQVLNMAGTRTETTNAVTRLDINTLWGGNIAKIE